MPVRRFLFYGFAHFGFNDLCELFVGFCFDGYADEVGAGIPVWFNFFVGEVLRDEVVFVVGEDLWRGFAEFLVLRRGDMGLVGGVIGIDFDHVRYLRIRFLFDGMHGERSRFFCQ